MSHPRIFRNGFLALLLAAVLLAVSALPQAPAPAQAQQPPPAWKQGQPDSMRDSPLSPIAAPPGPAPVEKIQVDKLKLPPGFRVELWASGINNARAMTLGSKGTLFVSSRVAGNVYAVVDKAGKREVKTIAKGLTQPNGVAFKDGTLYVAEVPQITKYEGIEDRLDNPPTPQLVYQMPREAHHNWRYLAFGPDGKLYFNMGAPCNICMPPDTHANISRINPDGTGFEYVAKGVRNSVGFDWHPVTRELYFANHGRDWLGDDVPNDTLHHVPGRPGVVPHFGFPFCHQGDILDPDFGRGRACSEFNNPLLKLGPHVAPIGIAFYNGTMFPPEYRNRLFVGLRGSWNRTQKTGYQLMMVTLNPGQPPKYEVFAEGWRQGEQIWGRPDYPFVMPDGSLLLSDDYVGAIYRITYRR